MAKNYNIYNIIYLIYYIIYIINIIYYCLHKYKCCLLFGCSFVRLFGFVCNLLIISRMIVFGIRNYVRYSYACVRDKEKQAATKKLGDKQP